MPPRFLSFHDGYAALYEYHNGPERKVFVDARLEVIGAELYDRYLTWARGSGMTSRAGTATSTLPSGPRSWWAMPTDAVLGASILANPGWRCVWFDPIVAVYVPRSYASVVAAPRCRSRWRGTSRATRPPIPKASPRWPPRPRPSGSMPRRFSRAGGPDLARPLVLLGLDYAGRIRQADPEGLDGWKLLGKLEMVREPVAIDGPPVRRYRLPFDPVHDLSAVRATYDLRRAHEIAPRDFLSLFLLRSLFEARGMDEAEVPLLEQLGRLVPINREQATYVQGAEPRRKQIEGRLGKPAPTSFENLNDLDKHGHRAPGARPRPFRRRVPRTGLSRRARAPGR